MLTFGQLSGILRPYSGAMVFDRNHNVIPRDKVFADVSKLGDAEVKFIEVQVNGMVEITLGIEEEEN